MNLQEVQHATARLQASGFDRLDAAAFALPPCADLLPAERSIGKDEGGAGCVTWESGRLFVSNALPDALLLQAVRELGARWVVFIVQAIAIHPGYETADVVFVTDHLSWIGDNPLIGPNDDRLGPRFPDMTQVYSKRLRGLGEQASIAGGYAVHRGVVASLETPRAVTPAEGRMLTSAGADLVAASIVPAAILAVHAGLEVLGIAAVIGARDAVVPAPGAVAKRLEIILREVMRGNPK